MVGKSNIKLIKGKIDAFRKKVENGGITDGKYYVFGSWAVGRENENSDIDLCVVSKKFGKNTFRESTFLRLLTIGIDDMLEPVAMSPEDLNDKYNTLAVEIKKWGVEV
jgi:predicted nucleotidyltransferase